jgi:hypothetical protein
VQKAGGKRGNQFGIISKDNNASAVADIGLTSNAFQTRQGGSTKYGSSPEGENRVPPCRPGAAGGAVGANGRKTK